jgi:hypothetical protein
VDGPQDARIFSRSALSDQLRSCVRPFVAARGRLRVPVDPDHGFRLIMITQSIRS